MGGVTVVIVLKNLLDVWWSKWQKLYDTDHVKLNIRMYIMHSEARGLDKKFPVGNEQLNKNIRYRLKNDQILFDFKNNRFIFVTTSGSYKT